MNTSFFEYALEVNRTGSITQAAENLFLAQPNLSKLIKEAEVSLGYEIFERTPKGVIPTARGTLFLEHAQEIVKQLQEMKDLAGADDEGDIRKLYVSIPYNSPIAKEIVNFIDSLDKAQPIELYIKECESFQAVKDVHEGSADFGIIRYQSIYKHYFRDYLAEKRLHADPICTYNYVVLLSKDHALADKAILRPQDLGDSIELLRKEAYIPYFGNPKNNREADPVKRIYMNEQSTQFELLLSIPNTFLLSPPIAPELLERYNLVGRQYASPTNLYADLLIYQQGYRFSDLEQKFIDKIHKCKGY